MSETFEHLGHKLVGSLASRLVRAGKWPVKVFYAERAWCVPWFSFSPGDLATSWAAAHPVDELAQVDAVRHGPGRRPFAVDRVGQFALGHVGQQQRVAPGHDRVGPSGHMHGGNRELVPEQFGVLRCPDPPVRRMLSAYTRVRPDPITAAFVEAICHHTLATPAHILSRLKPDETSSHEPVRDPSLEV